MGKHFQLVSVKAICASLGPDTCFTPLLFVTPPLASRARERDPLGKLGGRIVRLQMCSFTLPIHHITTWTRRRISEFCAHNFSASGTFGYCGVGT